VLHLLNGDATAAVFADTDIAGQRLVWRDILVEGPVTAADPAPEALAARAAWLAARLGIEPEAYTRGAGEQAAGLTAAAGHDEVVLWFEQDLFCAVNLWAVLDWFERRAPATRLTLVYPGPEQARGLGALSAPALAALFPHRAPVTDHVRALGRRAWAAYASPDPERAAALAAGEEEALPFVREAFRCHLGRFPSVATGLSEVEAEVLAVLRDGPRRFPDLFREVTDRPHLRRHGMGDVQLAACVRALGPLIEVGGADVPTGVLGIAQPGREVADGLVDRLQLVPLDTWLGGVRLRPGAPLWRWNGAHLVTSSG
jgi:hypothetical protein